MCFSSSDSTPGFNHLTEQAIYNHFINLLAAIIFQKPFCSNVCLFPVSGNWLQLLQSERIATNSWVTTTSK